MEEKISFIINTYQTTGTVFFEKSLQKHAQMDEIIECFSVVAFTSDGAISVRADTEKEAFILIQTKLELKHDD